MVRLGFLLFTTFLLSAQQEGETRIRTDVRQVLVPVIVTDSKGHHVTGLRAEDFAVYEDGARQTVTSFSTDTEGGGTAGIKAGLPQTAATPGAAPDSGRTDSGRTYVICFDTLHSSFGNFARIRDAVEKLFQKDDGSGAKYALVSLGRQLRVIQTATADHKQLLSKVRSKNFFDVIRGVDGGIMATELATAESWIGQYCGGCPCGPGAGRDPDCRTKRQVLRQQVYAQVERTMLVERAFYEGLAGLVGELAKVPGSRSMIMVSEGFSVSPGAEFLAVASAYLPAASEFISLPDTREGALRQVLATATQSDIRVYALDARGVALPSFAAGGVNDAGASLGVSAARNRGGGGVLSSLESKQNSIAFQNEAGPQQLAVITGGIYYHNNNDFFSDLRTATSDGREHYLLAYTPGNTADDGKYRKITVEVAGQRKGAVRAKDGYWFGEPAKR